MTVLNIVFAGTPAFGLPCLDAIAQSNHHLKAVYTQPDRPSGRGRKMQASAVKQWALTQNKPVYQPLHFKDPATVDCLAALEPDVLVVIAYGLILPKNVLTIPRLGCINVHASLLPAWRGASPIQQSILHGDKVTGVTIMQMDVGMDTGAMLTQVECPIDQQETTETLQVKLAQISAAPLLATLDALSNNSIKPVKQNENLVSYAPKILKEQAEINWSATAVTIDSQIRAYNPWPIAYTQLGEEVLRIHQASIANIANSATPGTVLSIDKRGIFVATVDFPICIERLQFPGGKAITVADWLNAGRKQIYSGLILG
jgi:methionyl-tRNA formyltransferase